jgi:hypothetical protein
MDRLTRRLAAHSADPYAADCAYCTGEFMTKRGCSKRCPMRKAQLERLACYEDKGIEAEGIPGLVWENKYFKEENAKLHRLLREISISKNEK